MTNSDDGQQWAEQVVKTFGETAKRVRGKRSARWLSDRTAELGYRVSPTVIAKLDTGHRGAVLHLPEILVIARALEVSPVSLIFGHLPDGPFRVSPREQLRSVEALNWFTADRSFPGEERHNVDAIVRASSSLASAEAWARAERQDVQEAQSRMEAAHDRLALAQVDGADGPTIARLKAEVAVASERFAKARNAVSSEKPRIEAARQVLKDLGGDVRDG